MDLGFFNLPVPKGMGNFNEDIIIAGIPYDKGSRFSGAKHAPNHLRKLSQKVFIGKNRFLMNYSGNKLEGFYNHQTNTHLLANKTISDYGNIKIDKAAEFASRIGTESFPVFIGGDHSITYHVLKGFYRRNVDSLFYFDAHEDIGEKSAECRNNNVVSWIKSLKNIGHIYRTGLRGYSCNQTSNGVFKEIFPSDTKMKLQPAKNENCYISIDMDVLEPYIFPAVSTPVMNGITYRRLKSILKEIFLNYNVIGIDIVEFFPKKDRDNLSGLLVLDLILYIFELRYLCIKNW